MKPLKEMNRSVVEDSFSHQKKGYPYPCLGDFYNVKVNFYTFEMSHFMEITKTDPKGV